MTTTAPEQVDLNDFSNGQKVRLVHREAGKEEATETKGVVEAVNVDMGVILVKPKGRASGVMVVLADIVELGLDEDALKPLKARTLKPVKLGEARQHLADRHGWQLDELNEMTEADALREHDNIDHAKMDLGHRHSSEDSAAPAEEPSTTTEGE